MEIRTIQEKDDIALAAIIRQTLDEFNAGHPGTVYYDESTDHLTKLFQKENSIYFVAAEADQIFGGAGIYPTEGLAADTVELVKMYLLPEARGKGLGKKLILQCIDFAKSKGYTKIYLETMPELQNAIGVYEKLGFTFLDAPLGNTGHHGCDIWMLKNIG